MTKKTEFNEIMINIIKIAAIIIFGFIIIKGILQLPG